MRSVRIAELLAPFLRPSGVETNSCHSSSARSGGEELAFLSPALLQDISTYVDLLLHWNARINLTAIRDPEQIVTRHFGESFFAARHLFTATGDAVPADPACPGQRGSPASRRSPLAPAVRLADLGSGAGFPGIPIKLWSPQIALALIESNHKKVVFLREIARALTLTDINIFHGRAESLPAVSFDVATLRAVEHFHDALLTASRLIVPAGRLALLIGRDQAERTYSTLPQFAWRKPVPVPLSKSRVLLFGEQELDPQRR